MDFITSVSPVTQASSMELGDSYRKRSVQNGQRVHRELTDI